jgi:hypothetical protein
MEDDLITIARFNRLMEAYMLKSRLESEGIECYIPDEMLAKSIHNYPIGMSQIRLQVKKEDTPKALEILNEEPTETLKDEEEF